MSGDTIECFNCGHANPSWAQVCRQCGFTLQADAASSGGPRGIVPTDQRSLIAIGASMGAIVLAIVLGLFVSGLIPELAAEPTPSPTPSTSVVPSGSVGPSVSAGPSLVASPTAIGTLTFGTGLTDTKQITGPTTSFAAGIAWAYSISLPEPFNVNTVQEEVVKVGADGSETIVQPRIKGDVPVNAAAKIAGFRVKDAATLVKGWGAGNFIMRVYRGAELLAEGTFTLS